MVQRTEILANWLRDAHAMERATIDNIERLIGRMSDHPAVAQRYREHLQESRRQLDRIDLCLRTIGAESSPGAGATFSVELPVSGGGGA